LNVRLAEPKSTAELESSGFPRPAHSVCPINFNLFSAWLSG